MTREEMLQLPDARIINTIQQANNFPEEQVEMAIVIAKEKELLSDEEIDTFLKAQEIEAGQGKIQVEIDENKLAAYLTELKDEESFSVALIGGIVAALVTAAIWATITVNTGFQIGYMAIGVGFIVGIAVRFLGKGISQKFGILGAICALLGCLVGNVLSIIGILANEADVSFFSLLGQLDWSVIPEAMGVWFNPIDLLFYGIALYVGYNYSFRQISEEEIIKKAAIEKVPA